MGLVKWGNNRIGKLGFWDLQAIKFSVLGFAFWIAKIWEPILSLDWYWYFLFFIIFAIRPFSKVLGSGK